MTPALAKLQQSTDLAIAKIINMNRKVETASSVSDAVKVEVEAEPELRKDVTCLLLKDAAGDWVILAIWGAETQISRGLMSNNWCMLEQAMSSHGLSISKGMLDERDCSTKDAEAALPRFAVEASFLKQKYGFSPTHMSFTVISITHCMSMVVATLAGRLLTLQGRDAVWRMRHSLWLLPRQNPPSGLIRSTSMAGP